MRERTAAGAMALIAYEDEVAGLSDVPLTAVAPPTRSVEELAAKLLLERLAERRGGKKPGPRQHVRPLTPTSPPPGPSV